MALQQTKGSFKLAGMTNIEKATERDLGWLKRASMNVKTLKDNFVNATFEIKNGKGLDVSIKTDGDEKSRKIPVAQAFNEVKKTFKNDNMLFIVGVTDYDTYRKEFVLKPSGVFSSSSNYDDADFEETNFVEQEFIFDSFNGKVAKLNIVSYYGEVIEIEMKVDDELKDEFETFKTGDFITAVFSMVNKPNYVESKSDDKKGGYTPKGKGVTQKSNTGKRETDGYITYNIIVGIANVEKGKYTRKEIRAAQEEFEKQQEEYKVKKETSAKQAQQEEDDDLPF